MHPRHLDRNLELLAHRKPGLARAIRAAESDQVEIVTGPKGHSTVSENGVLLASAYDPIREGERLAVEIARQPVDLLVAVGFGLGHHLAAFREHNRCPMLVYEPSLARVRAALSVAPAHRWLDDDDLVVTADPEELRQQIARRYVPGLRIEVYPHPSLLRLDPGAVQEAVDRVARVKDSIDVASATRQVMMQDWAEATVANARHLVQTPSLEVLKGSFEAKAAVICAAGPSLSKQLPVLREHRDRVLVIAIGQSLRALRGAGIEPDLVHMVDSQDVAHQLLEAGETRSLDLVIPPQTHASVFEVPVRRRWMAFQSSNPFGCWIGAQLGHRSFLPSGGTVVQCSVHLARELGCDPILLIGQDLAFTDGQLYAAGSAYDQVGFRQTSDGRFEYTNVEGKLRALGRANPEQGMGGDLILVEGFDGGTVATNQAYASFLDHYRDIGATLRLEGTDLVNCTEGGARIHGLRHAGFRETLEGFAPLGLDPAVIFAEAHEGARPDPSRVVTALSRLRGDLRRLRADSHKALQRAEKAKKEIDRGARPARQLDLLKGFARVQRKLTERLARTSILDALVQRELYAVGSEMHKGDRSEPSPVQVVSEGEALLRATRAGLDRARTLIDQLAAELSDL